MAIARYTGRPAISARIVAESRGHPLFLRELVIRSADDQSDTLDLVSTIQRRVAALPPFARQVLELVCLAIEPLPTKVIFDAAHGTPADDPLGTLDLLAAQWLIRHTGSGRCTERFVITEPIAPCL